MERVDVPQALPWQRPLWRQLIGWRIRLPHALLLHGARDIGKRELANAFAQLLLCESPLADAACGRCTGCVLMAAGNHPDLRWLAPEADLISRGEDSAEFEGEEATGTGRARKPSREILIDQVRAVGDFLATTSHRGGRRVVIVAPIEALNAPAANALLKMLEEPPAGAVFVAISHELDAVLPTIRSRCVLLRVPVPSHAQALDWLRQRGVADAEARLAEAGGAPLALLDEARSSLDPSLRETLLRLLARGATLDAADVVDAVPRDVPVAAAIRLLQRWGWDLLAERAAQRVRYHPGHKRTLATLARAVELPRLAGWLAALAEAQAVSDHPLNARLAVEQALLGYIEAMRPSGR